MAVKLMFSGRIGRDPEIRQTSTGKSVCSFSATVNVGKDKYMTSEWFDFTAWGETAEYIVEHYRKGSLISLSSTSPNTSEYTDKNGVPRKNRKWTIWSKDDLTEVAEQARQPASNPVISGPDDGIPF